MLVGCSEQRSHGQDGQLCGLRVEARPHPHHWLLLGGPGGSLEQDEWHMAIDKFLAVMVKRKAREWIDVKELTPLQFMPYVAKLF